MNILVTGGAGYIGSHAVRQLLKASHSVVVYDDLSHGHKESIAAASSGLKTSAEFVQGNVADSKLFTDTLNRYSIDAVMHFAAFIEVGESVVDPEKYYRNNFTNALSMLHSLRSGPKNGVKKIVFSSTAATYGNPLTSPIQEDHPLLPINPYGRSKMMTELAIRDFAHAYGLGFAILRYFNVAGASPEVEGFGLGEAHEPESHLIPRVLAAAAGKSAAIGIFGTDYDTRDGTCIRDYVHVDDLAMAHVLALAKIQDGKGEVYNIGSQNGFSVREVIRACEKATGKTIPVEEKPRRAGDPASLVASSDKIRKELGWTPKYPDLETTVSHAWKWHQSHPMGYKSSR